MLFLKLGDTCVFIEIFIYLNVSNISKYMFKKQINRIRIRIIR